MTLDKSHKTLLRLKYLYLKEIKRWYVEKTQLKIQKYPSTYTQMYHDYSFRLDSTVVFLQFYPDVETRKIASASGWDDSFVWVMAPCGTTLTMTGFWRRPWSLYREMCAYCMTLMYVSLCVHICMHVIKSQSSNGYLLLLPPPHFKKEMGRRWNNTPSVSQRMHVYFHFSKNCFKFCNS